MIREEQRGNGSPHRARRHHVGYQHGLPSPSTDCGRSDTQGLLGAGPSEVQSCLHCLKAQGRRSEGECVRSPGTELRDSVRHHSGT